MSEKRFPNDQLLVSTDWLTAHLNDADVRLVEVTPPGSGYVLAHLPGAVHLNLDEVFTGRDDGPTHMVGPLEHVAGVLGQLGLAPDQHVVVYDEIGAQRAAHFFWLLEYLGFERVSVLEGGVERWMAEGRKMTRLRPTPEPRTFTPAPQADRLATADWIASRLESGGVCLLDCRTPEEYAEGHIPSAGNRSWEMTLTRRAYQAFRETDELRAEFAGLSATEDREIVTYCNTGQRSAHTYLALRLLGYPRVRNYNGSWAEWSARPDWPKA